MSQGRQRCPFGGTFPRRYSGRPQEARPQPRGSIAALDHKLTGQAEWINAIPSRITPTLAPRAFLGSLSFNGNCFNALKFPNLKINTNLTIF